jgi:hypothetical protein
LPVSGQVVPVPSLTLSGNLQPLATTAGTASASRTFNVTGANLAGNVSVSAPPGFEVAGQRKAFAPSISLSPSRGALDVQVRVRLGRSAAAGDLSGNISVTSAGAADKQVAVAGSVSTSPKLAVIGSLQAFATTKKQPSASQTVTLTGTALKGTVSVTAPANFEVSRDNSTFSRRLQFNPDDTASLTTTVWLRVESSNRSGSLTGNLTASSRGASTRILRISGRVQ